MVGFSICSPRSPRPRSRASPSTRGRSRSSSTSAWKRNWSGRCGARSGYAPAATSSSTARRRSPSSTSTPGSTLASTIFKTNLEAVDEIVRQIILRDIGGIILVDLIDMENERHRKRVLQVLGEAVKADRAKIHIIDLTQLGLVEITRKRVHQDLEEVMRTHCPYCEGRGRVLSPETMSLRVRREGRRAGGGEPARAGGGGGHPPGHPPCFPDG